MWGVNKVLHGYLYRNKHVLQVEGRGTKGIIEFDKDK